MLLHFSSRNRHSTDVVHNLTVKCLTIQNFVRGYMEFRKVLVFTLKCILYSSLFINEVECTGKAIKKYPRETNVINFVRLLVLRLIYGVATLLGFGESISEVADGALVPPGVDDDYSFGDYREYERDYTEYNY